MHQSYSEIPSHFHALFERVIAACDPASPTTLPPYDATKSIYDPTLFTPEFISILDDVSQSFTKAIDQHRVASDHEVFGDDLTIIPGETELYRFLEGYVNLTPSPVKKPKLSLSRNTILQSRRGGNPQDELKHDDADDRIIVLMVTHTLDGSIAVAKELGDAIATAKILLKDEYDQPMVFAKVYVEQFEDIMVQFGLNDISSLPAFLFIQTGAERVDLRSVGVDPAEIAQLVHDSLISMVDSSGLAFDGDDDEDDEDGEGLGDGDDDEM